MKKEYKQIFENIKPDQELLDKIFDEEEKKNKTPFLKPLIAGLCLFIFVLGGAVFANSNSVKQPNTDTTSLNNTLSSNQLGIIVASADNSQSPKIVTGEIQTPVKCKVKIYDTRKMTSEQKETLHEKISKEHMDLCYGDNEANTIRCGSDTLDNAIIDRVFMDYFTINIDNPQQVKSIKATNQSEYAYIEINGEDLIYNDDGTFKENADTESEEYFNSRWIKGHKVELSGERYQKLINLKEKCGTDFQVIWKFDEPFYDEVNKNPDFDLTGIKDTISITVEFNDGSYQTGNVNLTFDENGYMLVSK